MQKNLLQNVMSVVAFFLFCGIQIFNHSLQAKEIAVDYTQEELQQILDENLEEIKRLLADDRPDGIQKTDELKESDKKEESTDVVKDTVDIEKVFDETVQKDVEIKEEDSKAKTDMFDSSETKKDEKGSTVADALSEGISDKVETPRASDDMVQEAKVMPDVKLDTVVEKTKAIDSKDELVVKPEDDIQEEESDESGVMADFKDEMSPPVFDIDRIEDEEGFLDESEEDMAIAGGVGLAGIGATAALASKAADFVDKAQTLKDIADRGADAGTKEAKKQSIVNKNIALQESLVGERRLQAERKLNAYNQAGMEDKQNKWSGRLKLIEEQEKRIAEQKALQKTFEEQDRVKNLTTKQKRTLAKEIYDKQKALSGQVFEGERKNLYARLNKYDAADSLTGKQEVQKGRAAKMLQDMDKRQKQLQESEAQRFKATTAREKFDNLRLNPLKTAKATKDTVSSGVALGKQAKTAGQKSNTVNLLRNFGKR